MGTETFLSWHFTEFMDAYVDKRLTRVRVEDLVFNLPPNEEKTAAVTYCIANDLDNSWVDKLLKGWKLLREQEPPPTPTNIILGEE